MARESLCRSVIGLSSTALGFRSSRSGMLRFQAFVLVSKRGVLLHQAIAGSCRLVNAISHLTKFFLQFQNACLQLFGLLSRFCILAGHQRQAQRHDHSRTSYSVLAHFPSSIGIEESTAYVGLDRDEAPPFRILGRASARRTLTRNLGRLLTSLSAFLFSLRPSLLDDFRQPPACCRREMARFFLLRAAGLDVSAPGEFVPSSTAMARLRQSVPSSVPTPKSSPVNVVGVCRSPFYL